MKNIKYVVITAIMMILLFLIPNISKATVEYTRTITGNDGSITIDLKGLELDTSKQNEFSLVLEGESPSTWHKITNCTATTANIELSSSITDIVAVLKVSDKGYLYIREKDSTQYKLNKLEVNLKLPYLNAVNISYDSDKDIIIKGIYHAINKGRAMYKWEKITDKNVIQKYLDYKNSGKDISANDLKQTIPTSGFTSDWDWSSNFDNYVELYKGSQPSDGLYYLWVKTTANDVKTIYGYYLHDGLPKATKVADYINGEGPKVTKIQVQSPKTGTYKTSQTVKIRVYFDGKITGSKVPTLKIKFGTSAERSVTNGTIHNDTTVSSYGQYIEYSYNIQSGDNGQLATVSLTGGEIKDEYGNNAILSCPALTGSITIKANTKGTVTNNTENQDKTNNTSKSNTSDKKSSSTSKSDGKDDTVAKGKIPYTGASLTVVFAIAIVLVIGIVGKIQYNKYRDI